ncbi:MAG: hypothetical protein ABH952_02890 [Candidatus Omnitrophota bacterium]
MFNCSIVQKDKTMKLSKYILALIIVILITTTAQAKSVDTRLDGEINYWLAEFEGKVQVTEAAIVGTNIELNTDLGIDDHENIPNVTIAYRLFNAKLTASYFNVANKGSKSVTQQFNYKGDTYPVGTAVDSKLDLTVIEGKYSNRFLGTDYYDLYGQIGIKYAEISAELNTVTLGAKTQEIKAPIPFIGVAVELRPFYNMFNFAISGDITGISINIGDADFTLIDFTGAISYDVFENLRVSAGYRYLSVDGADGDDKAEATYRGPFAAIVGSF